MNTTRRAFLGAAASAALPVRGANDRLSIGMIGCGGRGRDLLEEIEQCKDLNVAVTAVCDVYRPNLERAAADAGKTWGAAPFQTTDFRGLLHRGDIDAVTIATPDFGHSRILQEAVEAGKDAYCEKPMGVDFEEAKAAYLAVKSSKQVVQIGTQRRSDGHCLAAARLLQSGILGKVTRVDISVNFHEPRWRRDHAHVTEKDVAWDQFLFNRPKRPFDARRLREWQLFRDYTNGIAGLWMCHFIDLVHWWLDDPYPAGAVANGGVFLWKDGRETSDVFHALLDYPKGFLVSFAMSLTNAAGNRNLWLGIRGTLDANAWRISGEGSKATDRLEQEIRIEPEATTSHMRNFLECVRSRRTPRASVEAGFSHAVACSMAAQALETGKRVAFDRQALRLA
jgi:predicted dehydrogenase